MEKAEASSFDASPLWPRVAGSVPATKSAIGKLSCVGRTSFWIKVEESHRIVTESTKPRWRSPDLEECLEVLEALEDDTTDRASLTVPPQAKLELQR